jgi:hypothetical protein
MSDVKSPNPPAEERRDRPHRPLAFPGPEVDTLSEEERAALRWAREVCVCDVRTVRALRGATFALLLRCVSLSGSIYHEVDGFGSEEELRARLGRPGVTDRVPIAAYDVLARSPLELAALTGAGR